MMEGVLLWPDHCLYVCLRPGYFQDRCSEYLLRLGHYSHIYSPHHQVVDGHHGCISLSTYTYVNSLSAMNHSNPKQRPVPRHFYINLRSINNNMHKDKTWIPITSLFTTLNFGSLVLSWTQQVSCCHFLTCVLQITSLLGLHTTQV